MTMYRRRLLCFALALSMLITLIPAATGSRISAYAENVRMGITLDKVNLRYGAGTDQKIAFELPANHVCEILGDKTAQKIHTVPLSCFFGSALSCKYMERML